MDIPNLLQLQTPNRASEYNTVVTSQPEQASIAMFGQRKDSPQPLNCIQDVNVARMILGIMVRRQNYIRNTYKFKLKAKWKLLEPMDLVTINDSQIGISNLAVRLTSVQEDDQYNLDCEATPFCYGVNAPVPVTATAPAPYVPQTTSTPANVNAPIFIEPVLRLANNLTQIWIAVSNADPNYGGCQVFLSTDGGNSYPNMAGTLTGSAITGKLSADWPAAADPDSTNNLALDLTESNGELDSYQTVDQDNFTYPCYVAGGSASIPYELMTYAVATLTATSKYTLEATGGNHLRRGVYGAPSAGQGVDHPAGSRFVFLGPQAPGILKLTLDSRWIGQTPWFKFAGINVYGNGLQSLADVPPYPFTPTGVGQTNSQSPSYTVTPQTPGSSISNPSATNITMPAVVASIGGNTVSYNARSFTIPAPTVPTTYYITIADPGYVGDSGSSTNLVPTVSTTPALVGVPGNIYIGSVVALPAGGGTTVSPGGYPPQQLFLVNGS